MDSAQSSVCTVYSWVGKRVSLSGRTSLACVWGKTSTLHGWAQSCSASGDRYQATVSESLMHHCWTVWAAWVFTFGSGRKASWPSSCLLCFVEKALVCFEMLWSASKACEFYERIRVLTHKMSWTSTSQGMEWYVLMILFRNTVSCAWGMETRKSLCSSSLSFHGFRWDTSRESNIAIERKWPGHS